MRCHECGRPADYAPETGGITVGFCDRHLRQRLEEFPTEELKDAFLAD